MINFFEKRKPRLKCPSNSQFTVIRSFHSPFSLFVRFIWLIFIYYIHHKLPTWSVNNLLPTQITTDRNLIENKQNK